MPGFNATPLDGSAQPIPLSTGITPGDKTPRPIMTGPEYTDSQLNVLAPVQAYPSQGTSAAPTSVNASTSSVSLLAVNANRKFYSVYNESSAVLYLALGASASLTSYLTQVGPGQLYEMPSSHTWQGQVSGIWASATGVARITEVS